MDVVTRFSSRTRASLLAALLICAPIALFGAKPKNPVSKLYVADLQGEAEIDTGERIEPLTEKSVHYAEGAVLETKADSTNSIVLSNGTGVYLGPNTKLEIKRFVQEPFWPNRNDLQVEPSVSQMHAYVWRGTVGLCTARLIAGSSMVFDTPHASINIRGQRLLIQAMEFETRVSVLEGEVTVRAGENDPSGATLRGGQQAIVRRLPGADPELVVHDIPEEERPALDDQLAMACMARSTVYFDVESGLIDEFVPVPVTPIRPPVDVIDDNTVSASRIRG
jgi:hypothetical protein